MSGLIAVLGTVPV